MLNEDMVDAYVRLGIMYGKKALLLEGNEKTMMLSKQEMIIKISIKLRGTFKKQVIEELTTLFKKYDPDFTNKLDENKNLICFTNGVYDLENAFFREGRPTDYITLCTNIKYVPINNLNIKKLNIVKKFLLDIQPEETMRNYILDLYASCLAGNNKDQKFNIWTGSGSNGKSLVVTLMMESLGDYACGLPPEVLTRSSMDPDKASPTMAKTKGKRFVVFEEPENTDQIYVGKMKIYSGGVKIQARKLHKDMIEFYPQFKMFLLCNKLPKIPSNDGGTWRRIRLVPFDMKFVDNPTDDHERQIDRELEDVLRDCREEFISLLVERYKIYKDRGLIVPTKVMMSTDKYQSTSDIFLDYINERLDFTDNIKDKINVHDILVDMQHWLKHVRFDKRTIQRSDIQSEMEDKLGKCTNEIWKKFKIRPENKKSENIFMDEEELDLEAPEIDEIYISTYEMMKKSKSKIKKDKSLLDV
jgi:P4 family phage/plasmid primase-like protien